MLPPPLVAAAASCLFALALPFVETESGPPSVRAWSARRGWRAGYRLVDESWVLFAQDAFGGQLFSRPDGVPALDPETGEDEAMASNLDEWALRVGADSDFSSGEPIFRQWQARHGELPLNMQPVPTRAFVLGGDYSINDQRPCDAFEVMRIRAPLANELARRSDGDEVPLRTSQVVVPVC